MIEDDLIKSIKTGNPEEAKKILSAGLNVNFRTQDNWTALMYATVGGQVEIVEALLKAGADVNAQNDQGDTPLIKAVVCNHLLVTKSLLVNAADVNIVDNDGWTALSIAIARGNSEFIKILNQYKSKNKH